MEVERGGQRQERTDQVRRKKKDVLFWLVGFHERRVYLSIPIREDFLFCDRFGALFGGSFVSSSQSCLSPCPSSRHDC